MTATRVDVFLPAPDGGGAERSMLRAIAGLREYGYDAELVLAHGDGDLADELPRSVPTRILGHPHVRACVTPLRAHLKRRQTEVLITTIDHAVVVGWLATRTDTPTEHVPRLANTFSVDRPDRLLDRGWVTRGLAKAAYRRAGRIIAVSAGAADDLVASTGVDRSRVHVVPNPVVDRDLQTAAGARLDHPWFAPGAPPVVVSVGRLARQKNHDLLLRAFAAVHAHRPARLLILGEGPERPALTSLADSLGIAADVEMPGFDPNPFRYLSRAAAFVLSSDWEGSPGALIQAAACGTPLVATDCPSGPREVLAGGAYGRLVPTGDVTALTTAIDAALTDGRAAPEAAWIGYTAARSLAAYAEVIDAAATSAALRRTGQRPPTGRVATTEAS
jgi:glycosyltransferase involved in cell wall biosynthesis